MTTIFFQESTGKEPLKAVFGFLTSFSKTKPLEIKKEKTLDDLTREDYLASIPYNRKSFAISKSYRKTYGKI